MIGMIDDFDLRILNIIQNEGNISNVNLARQLQMAPSVFNKNLWTGKVMDWCMRNEQVKVQMYRFGDVLPYLDTSSSLGQVQGSALKVASAMGSTNLTWTL